jgi:hypothetical protein
MEYRKRPHSKARVGIIQGVGFHLIEKRESSMIYSGY